MSNFIKHTEIYSLSYLRFKIFLGHFRPCKIIQMSKYKFEECGESNRFTYGAMYFTKQQLQGVEVQNTDLF